jgi:hypothetical protein
LPESDFLKFTNNKYSLKVLKNYEEELKFKVGQPVQIRATNKIDVANVSSDYYSYPNKKARREYANKVGFILEVDSRPVTRAARGSRVYKILVTGETSPIHAHESDLKKARTKK